MNDPDREGRDQAIRTDLEAMEDEVMIFQRISTRRESPHDEKRELIFPGGFSQDKSDRDDRATDDPGVERHMPPGDLDLFASSQVHVLE